MVNKLFLLRHGQAEQPSGQKDFNRTLSNEGKEQLSRMSKVIDNAGFQPDLVLCSPAKRTKQTAEIVLNSLVATPKVKYDENIYEATLTQLLSIITDVDPQINNLLIIGHNPGLSYLLDYLTGDQYSNLSPGELAAISFEGLNWNELSANTGIRSGL